MKKELGSINAEKAAGTATLKNKNGKAIAQCLNTPNNIAAAFLNFHEAVEVTRQPPFEKTVTEKREKYEIRFHGLDMEYHKRYFKML